VLANDALLALVGGLVAPRLLEPPVNVLRTSLHPDGLAHHIVNLDEYAAHTVGRLRRQVEITGDQVLAELLDELTSYPHVPLATPHDHDIGVVLPLRIRRGGDELALFTTIATFGAPLDVTLSELAIEAFYPADGRTADLLHGRTGA